MAYSSHATQLCRTRVLFHALSLSVSLLFTIVARSDDQLTSIARFDKAILLNDRGNGGDAAFNTGFIVQYHEVLYLVTQYAVADRLSESALVGISGQNGENSWFDLAAIGATEGGTIRWHHDSDKKISVTQLSPSDNPTLSERLRGISIPEESLMLNVPQKGTRLEIVGFPVWTELFESRVTPFVLLSGVASDALLTSPLVVQKVVIIAPGANNFVLGAPIFLHRDNPSDCECAGMYWGTISPENNSVNFGIIVPAHEIAKLLKEIAKNE